MRGVNTGKETMHHYLQWDEGHSWKKWRKIHESDRQQNPVKGVGLNQYVETTYTAIYQSYDGMKDPIYKSHIKKNYLGANFMMTC